MNSGRFRALAVVSVFVAWCFAAEVQAVEHHVFIRCDPVWEPVTCPAWVEPNPVIVAPGDTVAWMVSASCEDPGAGPCAVAHTGVPPPVGCPPGGQGNFCIEVPGLGYGPITIGPTQASPATPAIPAPPPFVYTYTVGGSDPIQGEIQVVEDDLVPTVSEWGLVVMALSLLVGLKIYFGRRRSATTSV